ncbi:helix-turn-helix transcriptional regulator [Streptomyces sp. LZ34]
MIRPRSVNRSLTHPLVELKVHLREIREEQGLTQAQVAASAGISQARVSQIERGEIHSLETMRTYAAALGARITVSIEYGDRPLGAA